MERWELFQRHATQVFSPDDFLMERFEAVDTRDASIWMQDSQPLLHGGPGSVVVESRAWSELQDTIRRGHRLRHGDLTPGAVGCALSHLAVAVEAQQQRPQLDHVLVFEDDAQPTAQIPMFLQHAPSSFDMLLLGWSGRAPIDAPPVLFQRVAFKFWGLHAYVLSRRGMQRMIQIVQDQGGLTGQLDFMLSQAAVEDETLEIYGVNCQQDRIRQIGKGSDVAFGQLPSVVVRVGRQ